MVKSLEHKGCIFSLRRRECVCLKIALPKLYKNYSLRLGFPLPNFPCLRELVAVSEGVDPPPSHPNTLIVVYNNGAK